MRNASWVTEQTVIRDKIIVPRTQALQMFYEQLSVLVIKLARKLKLVDAKLGRTADKRIYSLSGLPDPDTFTVSFRYMPDNRRQKLANYSVGIALQGVLSEDTIIRDIFESDDPDGEIDKKRMEEARKANPVIFYYDMSARLIDVAGTKAGDEKKRLLRYARIAADAMVEAIKRNKMMSVNPRPNQPAQPKGSTQAMLALPSLMGGGGSEVGVTTKEAQNAG
jgi:hypothetical protein